MSYLKYEVNDYISVFSNDDKLQKILRENSLILNEINYLDSVQSAVTKENSLKLKALAELLLNNKENISSVTISDLATSRYQSAKIAKIFGVNDNSITDEILQYIYFSFKYSSIKSFFRINYDKFIPDYDLLKIREKDKLRIYMEAMMQEFDRFAGIIDKIYNLNDIDKVPDDYLKYMAQLVGYEKEESTLIDDNLFRELVKNIVEVYKIKGTNYSFELFFNFLGFNVEINEYWFDRRYYHYTENQNPYTGETNNTAYTYYLTTTPPYTGRPAKCYPYEDVNVGRLTKQLNVFDFNRLAKIYDPAVLLGYKKNYGSLKYTGDKYEFFKTNVAEFIITTIAGFGREEEIGQEEIEILKKYIQFLIPINIIKIISFVATPVEEDATGVINYYEETKVGEVTIFNNTDGNVSKNPKVYWNFDDNSDTSQAVDITGNGKYGTISGAAFSTTTANGSAHSLVFNGDTDNISATNIPYVDSEKSYSISCWVFWDGTYEANKNRIIWHDEKILDNVRYVNSLTLNQKGYLYFTKASYNSSNQSLNTKSLRTIIDNNKWVNIVCCCEFGKQSLYINNQYINSNIYEDADTPYGANESFYVSPNTSLFNNGNIKTLFSGFKGYVDDFAIFDRILSGIEIEDIYTDKKITLLYPTRNIDNTDPKLYIGFDESGFDVKNMVEEEGKFYDFDVGEPSLSWSGTGIKDTHLYNSKLYITITSDDNVIELPLSESQTVNIVKIKIKTMAGSGSFELRRELNNQIISTNNVSTTTDIINMPFDFSINSGSSLLKIIFKTPATYIIDFIYYGNGRYKVFNSGNFVVEAFGINYVNDGVKTKCMYFGGGTEGFFFKIHDNGYNGFQKGDGQAIYEPPK